MRGKRTVIKVIKQEVSITTYNAFCPLNVFTYKYADRLAKVTDDQESVVCWSPEVYPKSPRQLTKFSL
jgi:hypothetical protein